MVVVVVVILIAVNRLYLMNFRLVFFLVFSFYIFENLCNETLFFLSVFIRLAEAKTVRRFIFLLLKWEINVKVKTRFIVIDDVTKSFYANVNLCNVGFLLRTNDVKFIYLFFINFFMFVSIDVRYSSSSSRDNRGKSRPALY